MDLTDQTSPFRFDDAILHLGPTSATVVREFTWDQIGDYAAHFAADGAQAPPGDDGPSDRELDELGAAPRRRGARAPADRSGRPHPGRRRQEHRIELHAGDGVLNPPGVWHTADVHEPGDALFITPGAGTEHRPR